MFSSSQGGIHAALESKKDFVKFTLLVVLGALATSIVGTAIAKQSGPYLLWVALVCLMILVSILYYLVKGVFQTLEFEDSLVAAVIFDETSGELVDVKEYEYTDELIRVIKAVEAENKAIHQDWVKHPLVRETRKKPKSKSEETVWFAVTKVFEPEDEAENVVPSVSFLEEVTTYLILEQLSFHLDEYFGHHEENSQLVEVLRTDIPEFLLRNRILNLLTTPIEQRDIFINAFPNPENRPKGEIYSLFGNNGAMYKRFDLVLPRNSKIQDLGADGFMIETKRFALKIRVKYRGTSASMSTHFAKLYLGHNFFDLQSKEIQIDVSGRIKPLSLFSSSGWEYHNWLDSFRDRMRKNFHFKAFLDEIHWDIIEPLLYSSRKSSERRSSGATARKPIIRDAAAKSEQLDRPNEEK